MKQETIIRELLMEFGVLTATALHDKAIYKYSSDTYNPKSIANSYPSKSIASRMGVMADNCDIEVDKTKSPHEYSLKLIFGNCIVELENGKIVRAKLERLDEN